MNFSVVCLIGVVIAAPFGAAFVASPDLSSAIYGIAGWNPGTTAIGRLFGVELLYMAAALLAVRGVADPALQRRFAVLFAIASLVATVILVQGIFSADVNAMTWSTVAIYAFFTLAWGSIALKRTE